MVWQVTIHDDWPAQMILVFSRQASEGLGQDAVLYSPMNAMVRAQGPLQVALKGSKAMCSCVLFLSLSFLGFLPLEEMLTFRIVSLPVNV